MYGIFYKTDKKYKCVRKEQKVGILRTMPAVYWWSMTLEKRRIDLQKKKKKKKQTTFQNKKGNKFIITAEKSEFGQLNDER